MSVPPSASCPTSNAMIRRCLTSHERLIFKPPVLSRFPRPFSTAAPVNTCLCRSTDLHMNWSDATYCPQAVMLTGTVTREQSPLTQFILLTKHTKICLMCQRFCFPHQPRALSLSFRLSHVFYIVCWWHRHTVCHIKGAALSNLIDGVGCVFIFVRLCTLPSFKG